MLERLRGRRAAGTEHPSTRDPGAAPTRPGDPPGTEAGAHRDESAGSGAATAGAAAERERGHARHPARTDRHGGFQLGAAFFGWLVAVGITVLLGALLSAILGPILGGTAQGLAANAGPAAIGGAVVTLLVLLVAYFAGGYVAGRLSRFDGGRQGAGVWVLSIVVGLLLAVVGAVVGAQYDILAGVGMPRIPTAPQNLAIGGLITLVVVLLGTLLASLLGGRAGERYHRRIDRAAGAID